MREEWESGSIHGVFCDSLIGNEIRTTQRAATLALAPPAAYAQMWRWKARDGYLDRLIKTDPHPPTNFRPRTVRNIDAWYEAFDIPPDAALFLEPEERINPW